VGTVPAYIHDLVTQALFPLICPTYPLIKLKSFPIFIEFYRLLLYIPPSDSTIDVKRTADVPAEIGNIAATDRAQKFSQPVIQSAQLIPFPRHLLEQKL